MKRRSGVALVASAGNKVGGRTNYPSAFFELERGAAAEGEQRG